MGAFAQMMCPSGGSPATMAAVQASAGIPEKMWLRPGDTVTFEVGTGFHGVLFKKFGEHEMFDFDEVQKIFELDLKQFASTAADRAYTDGKAAGSTLVTAKVKADAPTVGVEELPFWCVVHEDTMSAVLRIAKAEASHTPRAFRVIGKRIAGAGLVWVINDGTEEFTLPKAPSSSTPAPRMAMGCPCCAAMMGGMRMGGTGMMGTRAGAPPAAGSTTQMGCGMMNQPARIRATPAPTTPQQMPGMRH
jgi:hypothetical protein